MMQDIAGLRERLVARSPLLRPDNRAYPWLVMAAVGFGSIMSILDTTVVNVAIAKLEVSFGASTDAVQWVITGYLLSFAVMLAAAGWLSDRFGYKTIFLTAVALFTFGSFLCSLSWSLSSLILFRIIQGIGGGMMGPVGGAYIRRVFPKEKLGLAMGIYIIPALVVSSFGPTIGGWIIDNLSWQLIFSINVPIGFVGLGVAYLILREYREEVSARFDYAGFASIALALGALLLALSDGNAEWNADGWHSTFILGCFAVSAVGFLFFFVTELTTDHPLIDFSIFKNYNYSLGSFVLFVFGLGIFGSDFLLPLYLQIGLGYTPMQAGVVFIPYGLGMLVTSIVGGRLTDRIGGKIPGLIGILLRGYGMYRFVFLSPYSSYNEILVTVLLLAAGMGLLASPIQTTIFMAVPVKKAAQGSGLIQVIRQLGGSFGVAILSTILAQREKFHLLTDGQAISGSSPVFKQVLSQAALHAMSATGGTASAASGKAESMIMSALQTHSFVQAINDTFFITMIISIVSSIPFLFLKTKPGRARTGANASAKPALE